MSAPVESLEELGALVKEKLRLDYEVKAAETAAVEAARRAQDLRDQRDDTKNRIGLQQWRELRLEGRRLQVVKGAAIGRAERREFGPLHFRANNADLSGRTAIIQSWGEIPNFLGAPGLGLTVSLDGVFYALRVSDCELLLLDEWTR